MLQRQWLLLLLVLCAFAGPASGQTIDFLDAQGGSLGAPYFEGARAYLRVVDPAVSASVQVDVSAAMSGDAETIELAETGAGTGVFEGSIELSISPPSADGRLQTSRDVSHYPWTFDTLTAAYGAAGDTAGMVGSTVEALDAAGAGTASYVVGDRIHVRVVDVLANATSGVDTTVVLIAAWVRNYGESEAVTLTETGGDTGIFEGSIQSIQGIDPVQNDGAVEVEPGDTLRVVHYDLNGQTDAVVEPRMVSSLPVTIELVDGSGQPVAQIFEFHEVRVRATDGAQAGLGALSARLTSDLRGDEEWVNLGEDPENPGVFTGSIYAPGTLATYPPWQDGWLEVTEQAGPPLQRDTLHAFLEGCSTPPCPTASAGMIGSTIRLTDGQWADLGLAIPGSSIYIEVRDHGIPYYGTATVTIVSQSGDSETVSLGPANTPSFELYGYFRGSIDVETGPAVPGDGRLQVQAPDVLTASHLDPLGLSSSTDTASVNSGLLEILDRTGSPVDYVLVDGDVRVRALYPAGDTDPGAADTVTAIVRSRESTGGVREEAPLELFETGPGTGVFTGQMPTRMVYYTEPQDGVLQTWVTNGQNDTVEVALGSATTTATLLPGILRIVDSAGADVTNIPPGGTVYLHLESDYYNTSPTFLDQATVRLLSLTSGDEEYLYIQETGLDTSIFQGSLSSTLGAASLYNGTLETQLGETVRADHSTYFGTAFDLAVVGDGNTASNPPNAVDDTATTADDTAVSIDVLANDSDPDGHSFGIVSFTQGSQGGTVTNGAGGALTYMPPPYFTGTDTFTYRLRDQLGDEDSATVTVTVEFVNDPPSAGDDFITIDEDQPLLTTPTDNDHDPEGQGVTIIAVTQASKGTAALYDASLGYVSYIPNPNANGSDSFTYTVRDPQGATATATIHLTIRPVNDPPVAVDDTATTAEDILVSIQVRDNDSDPDGDTIWISNVTQGAHGQVGASATYINYQAVANYNGTDTFTYTINDGNGQYSTATVTVTITPVNDPPVAVTDNATTNEDTPVTIDARANDSDPDGHALSITAANPGFHGTVAINANGSLTYTPAANYNGTDWFNYTLTDSTGSTATGRVNITINPVNDAPDAVNDTFTMQEDGVAIISVLANDTDVDGNPRTITGATQGAHGLVEVFPSSVRYTPALNYNGSDSFTYTISDGQGGTDTATVTVTITPVRDFPVAVADGATTPEDTPVVIDVMANDSDPDGDPFTIFSVTQGTGGVVTFTAGSVTFTPNPNFNGTSSFTYSIRDSTSFGASATVTVTVTPVNDLPVAVNDAAATLEDTPVTINVLTNDTDLDGNALAVTAVTQGAKGSVSFNAGSVTYNPSANANGADSFTYTVSDGNGGTATATVSITISAVNDNPVAVNDAGTTNEDTAVTISVLTNDSDLEGQALAVTAVTQGANGSVTLNAGSVIYTPSANFNGADSFTYTISDGNGGTANATVSITVSPVNDNPVAANDAGTTTEDTAVTISVLANDSDLDGDSLSVTAVTQGAKGSVTFNAGSVTYTPNANANGSDSFTYTIGDGNGGTATATVSITISAVNDNPVAANDAGTTNEDTAVTISVLANDSDLDGDALSVTAVTQGAKGSVTFNAGSVTYTPNANANGGDSFTYTIGDGNGGTATATVSITISAVNDAPDAVNDAAATNEDTAVILSILANDVDVDGEAVILTGVTQGTRGSVAQNANGTVTYTPNPNTFGLDSFTYTVRDAAGLTDSAAVTVNVAAINDPPDAINDSAIVNEGGSVVVAVLANDTDLEANALAVTTVSTPAHGTATRNANNTITYVPIATYSGSDSFTYTISDGTDTDTATVTLQIKDVIGQVAVLGMHSVWIQTGADVLSGDVVVNDAGTAPFLGATEISLAGSVTAATGWDVKGNRVTVASGASVASDVYYNQLTNTGTVSGAQYTPLSLPVFTTLPAFLSATPGTTDVSVANNGIRTLAPGSYRDLIVGKSGTVTFTGGTYHFRSISVTGTNSKLLFSAASTVRVQQKMSTTNLTTIGPGTGSSATAATIVFHVAGINGTTGTLATTPKSVEIGVDNTLSANVYAPNGSIWLKDRINATGAYVGLDVQVGIDGQVTLSSAW